MFTLFFDDFPDFLSILGMQKISEIQKIEIFGIMIKKLSYSVFMCLNHQVSESLRLHKNLSRHQSQKEASKILERVGLPSQKFPLSTFKYSPSS